MAGVKSRYQARLDRDWAGDCIKLQIRVLFDRKVRCALKSYCVRLHHAVAVITKISSWQAEETFYAFSRSTSQEAVSGFFHAISS